MKSFKHINAKSIEEAESILSSGKAVLNAGGTDLLGTLKDNVLPDYPETVINLKSIPDLEYINEANGTLKIGALTRLADISENPTVMEKYTALAQAASAAATPNLRNMASIAGNILSSIAAGISASRTTALIVSARAATNALPSSATTATTLYSAASRLGLRHAHKSARRVLIYRATSPKCARAIGTRPPGFSYPATHCR